MWDVCLAVADSGWKVNFQRLPSHWRFPGNEDADAPAAAVRDADDPLLTFSQLGSVS